jgi:DNA repair exonuclease SbcCD nuclease subunit
MVSFFHAADIHLDSPLTGLTAHEGAPVERLRTATRAAFVRLIDAAIDEDVDFVILAGDLYDGNWRDYNTGLFFCREMGRLQRAGIDVYLAYGNHDADSEITRRLPLPDNVHVFAVRTAQTFRVEEARVALHGQSFKARQAAEALLPNYPDPVPGWLNIGVLHTALEGHAAHATYAPCTLRELVNRGYDYWALGHVHEFGVLHEAPWVVFPGNLQGRHVRECGPRGCVRVDTDGSEIAVERRIFDVVRWHHAQVDAGGCETLEQVADALAGTLDRLAEDEGSERPLAVRLTARGRTSAHGALMGLETQLRAEVLARALARHAERVWLEKIVLETEPRVASRSEPGTGEGHGDAFDDLQRFLHEARSDAPLAEDIAAALSVLVHNAPYEVVRAVAGLERVRSGDVEALIRRAGPALLARIAAGDPSRSGGGG